MPFTSMENECLICKAQLEYLQQDKIMECAICHTKENSKTQCKNHHYVCSQCHTKGIDAIIGLCLDETSSDPIHIIEKMMAMPFCHMHGPEHHVMAGAALLTAYKNAGGDIELDKALVEMGNRGKNVPGGACGFWGACGAGISTGIFLSIATKTTPLSQHTWGLGNQITSLALNQIGHIGGPRCCKRNSYLAILSAIDFVSEHLKIQMEKTIPSCTRTNLNNQCIKDRCPFFK